MCGAGWDHAKREEGKWMVWTKGQPGLDEIIALLRERPDGPFVLGKEAGFADFVLAGFWKFAERTTPLFGTADF